MKNLYTFQDSFSAVFYDFKTPIHFLPSQINQKNICDLIIKTQFYKRIQLIP